MKYTPKNLAGALIFIGTAWLLLGIIVSEALYPGYRVTRMVSDLGVGSTAFFFNSAMIGFGLLILVAACLLRHAGMTRLFLVFLVLTGIGAAGVGIFPENIPVPHAISAITVFVCGSICALAACRCFSGLWSLVSPALGIIALTAMILLGAKVYCGLSAGGMERMIVYPLILWALGTGAYLMAPEQR
ncbi:MAG: DUF998 domain-containing protein [Methanoregula sp.]